MREMIRQWIDKAFGSHIVRLKQLERDLYDWKVKAEKLDDKNFELQRNEERHDDEIRSLTRDLQDALAKYINAAEANDASNDLLCDAQEQIIELRNKNIDLRKRIQDLETENNSLKQQVKFQFPVAPYFIPCMPAKPGQSLFTCSGDSK